MLIGEYTHTIDPKNRLSLPAKFRQEMGKEVVLSPGLDACIFVFTTKQWQVIAERLGDASLLSADMRSFNRFLLGGAVVVPVDSLGRMLVPDHLKVRANLTGQVAVVGVKSRVELWDASAWSAYKSAVEKQADNLAEKLGSVGVL
jgi:MraZ protein